MCPFETKVPLGIQLIYLHLYSLNLVISKQADAILNSYIGTGLRSIPCPCGRVPSYALRRNPVTPLGPLLSPTHARPKEILTGNVPSRPDYHTPAPSAFAAPGTPAPPPKAQLRLSSRPCLAQVGFAIPLGLPPSP